MYRKEKIAIFGAGNYGKMALEYYGFESVLCFIDNNVKKIGGTFCGKTVISLNELIKKEEVYQVVIATNAYKEISEQLKKEGIIEFGIYLPQYTRAIDSLAETQELEGKRVVLFGVDQNIEVLMKDLLWCGLQIQKLLLADTEGSSSIGHIYDGCEVKEFGVIKDMAEVIVVASQPRTYALQTYLNREVKNEAMIINPFIQKAYYDMDELVFSPYGENQTDATERDWNDAIDWNPDRQALDEYVTELGKEVPLFEHVEIETVNRCNGKCDFCPVSVKHDIRERHLMSEELFRKIINQLAEIGYSGRLATFSNNEPFLDTRIIEFNRYAREKLPKARLHLFTNGTVMTLAKFKEIIEYLDELVIDNYNQRLELNENSIAVKRYCEQHPELNKKVTIVMRKEQEILTSRGGDAPNRKQMRSFPQTKCALPFKQLIIRPDGKVSLCCNDPYGRMTLGDTNKESLKEIWYGEKFAEVRDKLSSGRGMLEHCRYCDTFILF